MAFKPSAVQDEYQIHAGSSTNTKSDTVDTSEQDDILYCGLWTNGQDTILDIRVTNTDQASYVLRNPQEGDPVSWEREEQ